MWQSIYLAYKYISFHRTRSLVLLLSLGIIIYLPNGLKKLITESEAQMMARAKATPLIIGAKGSSTDLVINTLYFRQVKTGSITMNMEDRLNNSGFGYAIPIVSMFSVRSFPIVGTDPDYFDFRKIGLRSGRWISFLGECVIGQEVSEKLAIGVGDSLVSSPENLFDLAGAYPLKMNVVGVLNKTNSPDDYAVFVDIKTNWVIMGLGHGHDNLSRIYDPAIILNRDSSEIQAGAKLYLYNTINVENIDSFHFHGDIDDYPLTSMIFVPKDHKSETILRGRFETGEFGEQIIVPEQVVNNLLQSIFRIKKVFSAVFLLVGVSTLFILGLIVVLSVRLRKNEIYTMFTIGSSKNKIVEVISFELLIITFGSLVFATLLYSLTGFFVEDFIQRFIL